MLFDTKKTQRAINLRLNWPFESGWKEAKNCYYRGHCTWVRGDTTSYVVGAKKVSRHNDSDKNHATIKTSHCEVASKKPFLCAKV